jgi:hypothetical protein
VPPSAPDARIAVALEIDRELADDARLLVDPRFHAALRLELATRLPAPELGAALLQLGFLRGWRDAAGALSGSGILGSAPGRATPALVAMRLVARAPGAPGAPVELAGVWPEAIEAEAVLAASGRTDAPACRLSSGYTSGWLSRLFHADLLAVEAQCVAAGDAECRFEVREAGCWDEADHPAARAQRAALPLRELRAAASGPEAGAPLDAPEGAFDRESPAVHVWGPVMVIPFSGADETLRAVELIGRDAGARSVSVVVLDLAGALVDEAFGAAALERVLEAIAGWGAEAILTGVSPLSEHAVAGLDAPHLVVRKDLDGTIAAALQVAELVRRPV